MEVEVELLFEGWLRLRTRMTWLKGCEQTEVAGAEGLPWGMVES